MKVGILLTKWAVRYAWLRGEKKRPNERLGVLCLKIEPQSRQGRKGEKGKWVKGLLTSGL